MKMLRSLAFLAALAVPAAAWTRMPDLATGRSAHAVTATERAIYVLGGTGADGQPVREVEKFDGRTWSQETVLPGEGVNAPAAAALNGAIYLIGGFGTTTNRPVTTVRRYDLGRREWSEVAPLPAPRGGHAVAILDGRIHVFGGGNSVSTIDDHTVYDPKTNTWTERARLPRAMGSPAAAVVGERLYSIGGRSGRQDFGDVHVYDAAKDAWTPGPAIPARGTAGAAVLGGTIYLFGGESQAANAVLSDVLRLEPGSSAWTQAEPMTTARSYARAVVLNSAIYVVGGSTQFGSSHASRGATLVERFTPTPPARR
jgi:N-acetylneuraminic acid mutarotase